MGERATVVESLASVSAQGAKVFADDEVGVAEQFAEGDVDVGAVVEHLGSSHAIDVYEIDGLEAGRRITYDVKAYWKLNVENFMECYHCATIHPELTEVLPEFADGYAAQYYVGHGAEFGEAIKGFTVDGSEGFDKLPGVTDKQDRRYYAITIKPQVFVNLVPDQCERCQPAMSSRAYAKGGVLVPSEHHIGAFHDWVTEKIGGTTCGPR